MQSLPLALLESLSCLHTHTHHTGSCGGSLYSRGREVLTSPNYPAPYPPNLNCVWTITAGQDQIIQLNFSYLSLEPGYDELTVYDGFCCDTSKVLERLSGSLEPRLSSSVSSLAVPFRTASDKTLDESLGTSAQGGLLAPSQGGHPAPSQGGLPAPSQGGHPAPSQGGLPAPSQGGHPAPSQGGLPAPSQGGHPAPSQGGHPAYQSHISDLETNISQPSMPCSCIDNKYHGRG